MKGSDKKKFKSQVKTQFSTPDCDSSIIDSLLPAKEEATITKIYTHNGDSVLVYSVGKDPLFFEIDKQKVLYPTVYTLWKYPELLGRNFMSTVAGVVPKITNGADVMLPGIVADVENRGMKAYCDGKLKKGDPLFVNLVENKAAVAVGTAFQSSEDLYMQGMRGKAVNVLHCVGDHLWMSGSKTEMPNLGPSEAISFSSDKLENEKSHDNPAQCEIAPENTVGDASTDMPLGPEEASLPSIENAVTNLLLEPASQGLSRPKKVALEKDVTDDDGSSEVDADEDNEHESENESETDIQESDPRSPEEIMDELIQNAFLQALKTTATEKKLELPALTSSFYRQHMLPACPSEIGGPIDIKKSSFKKLGKFLNKMVDEKIITIKEQKKGVEVIASIDYNHEKVSCFRPVKIQAPESSKQDNDDNQFVPPVITELYLVTAQVSNFFSKCGMRKGDGLTSAEVRECIRDYVNKENLQHPTDSSIINLDPVIAEAVLVKGENLVVTFRWDKLTSRITNKMTKGYSMDVKIGNTTKTVVQKGKLEPIEMMLGTRSGNKKVTLIHNLDLYGIDMSEFAHKCQVGVAASTTIHEAPNKKRAGGHPVMEVLVQGNQVAFASKLLIDEYKLPRKYIRGTELAAKKKGGKK